MKKYVAGFLFDEGRVALIEKLKPSWQRGRLNGVGGSIENGEAPFDAMVREFAEETGASVEDWRQFCVLRSSDWMVHWFVSRGYYPIESKTEEQVHWYPVSRLQEFPHISNLQWLIPLALGGNSTAEIWA